MYVDKRVSYAEPMRMVFRRRAFDVCPLFTALVRTTVEEYLEKSIAKDPLPGADGWHDRCVDDCIGIVVRSQGQRFCASTFNCKHRIYQNALAPKKLRKILVREAGEARVVENRPQRFFGKLDQSFIVGIWFIVQHRRHVLVL